MLCHYLKKKMHTPCNFTTTERILKQSLNVFPFWRTGNRWYLSLNLQCLLLLHQVTWILEILSCTQPTGRGHYCRSGTILRVWCKLIHITFSIPLWKKCYALFIKNMRNLKSHLPYSSYWESADFRKRFCTDYSADFYQLGVRVLARKCIHPIWFTWRNLNKGTISRQD